MSIHMHMLAAMLSGEKWSRTFEVAKGSSVKDLQRQMAPEEAKTFA